MRVKKHLWVGIALFVAMMWMGGAAQATPTTVTIGGVVTFDPTGGDFPVGTSFSIDLFLDDATPNEDVLPFYYAGGGVGTLSAFFGAPLPVPGTVEDVFGEGSTFWDAYGIVDLSPLGPLFDSEYYISLTGAGMTPGQILPDFVGGVTGTIDVSVPGSGEWVLADVTSLSIVPEPSTALLLGLGLIGLGTRRGAARRRD